MSVWGGLTNRCEKKRSEKQRRKGYTHLNAEIQRIARRDKKTFLRNQCKETEENNRMGKARDLFKKIRDTKEIFHAKMGSIKDRNGRDLTWAKDIKKRCQEYTEELYRKDIHDPDNHKGVIIPTHLEPDILECEFKWALESITMKKASGGDGIPVDLFQILRDDAVSASLNTSANVENSTVATGLERSVFIPIPKKGNPKQCSNYHTIALISHASKEMLTVLQARLQHMWTVNFQMLKLVLEKAEEQEVKFQQLLDHWKSKRVPEKHLFLLYWLCQSLCLCGSQ